MLIDLLSDSCNNTAQSLLLRRVMLDHVEIMVIGAGAVGLAIGRELARAGRECLILEGATSVGQGVSSRNSEVIHAGIYYPKGSKKANLCVEGKTLLYDFCEQYSVPFKRCGKLIVATDRAELDQLASIADLADGNGVKDLIQLTQAEVSALEPNVQALGALLSPSTGILSAHDYMNALLGDFEANGGLLSTQSKVTQISRHSRGFRVTVRGQSDQSEFEMTAKCVINAAGLGAQAIASAVHEFPSSAVPKLFYCKGNYFAMAGRNPFNHLIYPAPPANGAGLGIHATIDLGGQVKFGPDVEYVTEANFEVSTAALPEYYRAIRRYFPALKSDSLNPSYAGIRPKIQAPGEPAADFLIREESDLGFPHLVNLFGIESPGLTASLAIARLVAQKTQNI